MKLRSAFLSPPAVAAFALLALVIGTIFGVRASLNDGGDTEVAGTVIERSESAVVTEAPASPAPEPAIIRPRPARTPTEAPVVADPEPAPVAEPADEEEPAVGLIPDPDGPAPAPEPDPEGPAREPRPEPEPEPEPEPTRRPRPRPEPRPDPEPTPDPTPDTTRFAMTPGEGHSQDTALAEEQGNSGKFEWLFRSVVSHGGTADMQASRSAAQRMTALFSKETTSSNESVRDFRCDAQIDAGSRRLITDTDHEFEISLWTSDGYSPLEKVNFVILRQALDLAPGEHAMLHGNTVPGLDAADDVDYTCRVEYRERQP